MDHDFTLQLDAPLPRAALDNPRQHSGAVRMFSGFPEYLRAQEARDQALAGHLVLDPEYESQEGIRDVIQAVRDRAPIIFVSGRAGTGKSRLIDYLRRMPEGRGQVVVAPTGVAALALRAATIHSVFRLPIGVIDAAALVSDGVEPSAVLRRMSRLVIDEVGMTRADILDAIDMRMRIARGDPRPFGGVQVIMVGDFLQLPPIVRDEDRSILERLGYETPFAFSAKVMQRAPVRVATLRKVWRQSDPAFISALGALREGRNVQNAINWLNARCARPHRVGAVPLMLTATRATAEAYNADGIADLQAASPCRMITFTAECSGAFDAKGEVLPAPDILRLCPGVRVMSLRNDPAGQFVNGSLGEVIDLWDGDGDLDAAFVLVRFDGREAPTRIAVAEWTKSRQVWDREADTIAETEVGSFRQIPLTYGYAITIHRSQGLSLDDVRIDLGRGAFAPGQLYVALSRARSIEGLSLARPIELADVRVDTMLLRFLEWTKGADNLEFPKTH